MRLVTAAAVVLASIEEVHPALCLVMLILYGVLRTGRVDTGTGARLRRMGSSATAPVRTVFQHEIERPHCASLQVRLPPYNVPVLYTLPVPYLCPTHTLPVPYPYIPYSCPLIPSSAVLAAYRTVYCRYHTYLYRAL